MWLVALGCGSTSVSEVTGPSGVRCQVSLSANPQSVGPDGGNVAVTVATTRDCSWTASADVNWIRLSSASGQGETSITASVDANPQITSRSGNVSVNGQRFAILEQGRPCTFSLAAASAQFGSSGGSGRIAVTTIAGCSWKATTTATWIQVASTTISGSGGIDFQVTPNDGADRTAVIAVADQEFVVTQAAAQQAGGPGPAPTPNCTASVTPLTLDLSAAASTQTIQVAIGTTCTWSAVSGAGWLTIASPASATGPAVLTVAVAANTGADRSSTLTVAGQQVTVHQAALSCTFTLSSTSLNVPAAGGNGRVTVTTTPACGWTASADAAWVVLSVTSGTGTGDVSFTVQPNTATTARSATISVSGQKFTISQAAAACSYALNPASVNIGADGGHSRFSVATSANCAWTAVAGAAWVDVSNQSGNGSSDINFNVQANTAAARSTTITVGGQTFTVNQAGTCTYALNPASANVAAAASNGQFTVTTQAGCVWAAVSAAMWVSVTAPANGTGSGTADVTYSVQANSDQNQRSTTITVGGQTYTITQAAAPAPCTYSLNPTSGSFTSVAGNGTFAVTTQAGCAWTATTMDPWISITTANGSGTGDVSYAVLANGTGAARSGTISVGGQTYSVTQSP